MTNAWRGGGVVGGEMAVHSEDIQAPDGSGHDSEGSGLPRHSESRENVPNKRGRHLIDL